MILRYVFENGKLDEVEDQILAPILVCSEPDQIEKMFLQTHFDLGQHTLSSMLDENELPRIENRDNKIVIICKHPMHMEMMEKDIEFGVMSLGLVIYENRLLLISNEPIAVKELVSPWAHVEDVRDVLIQALHRSTMHFHEHLRCINLAMDQLEETLEELVNEPVASQQLKNLFSFSKSMTYYANAVNGNNVLMERIYNNTQKLGFNDNQKEVLDDIRLDSAQCCQEAQIITTVITKMTDARISLMGNNMSILMKRLTIISLMMMPMNLIAGIGGMSEFTAFSENYLHMPMSVSYPLLFLMLGIVGILTYLVLAKLGLLK
ncbi:MAG: magnesium transporter CorA family protein [Planctomycetia bacterium]|nr:magnesium transporter CorA family protein [Planctomycetia bacterium]